MIAFVFQELGIPLLGYPIPQTYSKMTMSVWANNKLRSQTYEPLILHYENHAKADSSAGTITRAM